MNWSQLDKRIWNKWSKKFFDSWEYCNLSFLEITHHEIIYRFIYWNVKDFQKFLHIVNYTFSLIFYTAHLYFLFSIPIFLKEYFEFFPLDSCSYYKEFLSWNYTVRLLSSYNISFVFSEILFIVDGKKEFRVV